MSFLLASLPLLGPEIYLPLATVVVALAGWVKFEFQRRDLNDKGRDEREERRHQELMGFVNRVLDDAQKAKDQNGKP